MDAEEQVVEMKSEFIEAQEYRPGRILIVDDEKPPRQLLKQILQAEGHEVRDAESADQACAMIEEHAPDVILMDVMMPGRTGFELCRELKSRHDTAHIPILLISGLTDRDDRLKGIEAGANDFIGKPIDVRNVMLRVRNAVYSKHLHDRVDAAYRELKKLEELRDNLTHMIIHDLRSPLTGALGYLELLQLTAEDKLDAEERETLESIYKIVDIVMNMINSVLDVNRLEQDQMPVNKEQVDLVPMINDVLDMLTPKTAKHIMTFKQADESLSAYCDPVITRRVITNLVMNAASFTPPNTEVEISIQPAPQEVIVQFKDNGPGVRSEDQGKIFDKFGFAGDRKERKQHSVGLGLAFCKLAMESQGGKIGLYSKEGEGSTFWVSFPVE
jgi:two-component system sensor histidine kinase/response regulator